MHRRVSHELTNSSAATTLNRLPTRNVAAGTRAEEDAALSLKIAFDKIELRGIQATVV
ncbi:hypothetical protein [Rhizobium binxianense]